MHDGRDYETDIFIFVTNHKYLITNLRLDLVQFTF